MEELLLSLKELLVAGGDVLASLTLLIARNFSIVALAAWIGFWLFAVNWVKLRQVVLSGGWIGILLIGVVMIIIWGVVAPPPGGAHRLLGLTLGNFVGKTVFVSGLTCIMFLCGSVQLSGFCASCCRFEEDQPEQLAHASHHGHGDNHGHGGH